MEKTTLGVIIAAFASWALKEIYSAFKDKTSKNTEVTQQNTLALMEVKIELKYLNAAIDDLKRLKTDVNAIHVKLRGLEKQ